MRVLEVLLPQVKRDEDNNFIDFDYTTKPNTRTLSTSGQEFNDDWFAQNSEDSLWLASNLERKCIIEYIEGIIKNINNIKDFGACKFLTNLDNIDDSTFHATYHKMVKSTTFGALSNARTTYDIKAEGAIQLGDGYVNCINTISIDKTLLSGYVDYTLTINQYVFGTDVGIASDDDIALGGANNYLLIRVDTRDNGSLSGTIEYYGNKPNTSMYNDFETID